MNSEMNNNQMNKVGLSMEAFKIGEAAMLGMLFEVSAFPSPGLVSPVSAGAHKDMDFFTFLSSSAAITGAMYLCAQAGLDAKDVIHIDELRKIGLPFEENMFTATKGVNTQKGILFIAGIIAAAAGSCIRKNKAVDRKNISSECEEICKDMSKRELHQALKDGMSTNGIKVFKKYGVSGIRGEVEGGLKNIIIYSLPAYDECLAEGMGIGEALAHTLLVLMTKVEDTTVLNRCGIKGYEYMKASAEKALEVGGMKSKAGRELIKNMEVDFIEKNISPGGVADLLAATVMIHKLEKDFMR